MEIITFKLYDFHTIEDYKFSYALSPCWWCYFYFLRDYLNFIFHHFLSFQDIFFCSECSPFHLPVPLSWLKSLFISLAILGFYFPCVLLSPQTFLFLVNFSLPCPSHFVLCFSWQKFFSNVSNSWWFHLYLKVLTGQFFSLARH